MKQVAISRRITLLTGLLSFWIVGCGGGLQPSREAVSKSEKTSGDASNGTSCQKNAVNSGNGLRLNVTNPTWNADIKPFILGKCAYCHAGQPGDYSPMLTTYSQVSTKANEILKEMKATSEPMPPVNATPKLIPDDITMMTNWIANAKPEGTPPPVIDPTKPVYYDPQIKSLLTTYCTSCHAPGIQAPDLSTYDAAKSMGAISLADIKNKTMPPSLPLSANDTAVFQKWADTGYLLNSTSTPPPPPVVIDPTKPVYYDPQMKSLLAQYCTGCHKPGGNSPDLTTYDAAKAAGSLSLADVKNQTMPKGAPLSANDVAVFQKWTDSGYPLNGTTTPPPPPPPPTTIDPTKPVYYEPQMKSLLGQYCTVCHKPGGDSPDLSTYEGAKAAGVLSLADVKNLSMPKGSTLSSNDIAVFQKWTDLGYPLDDTTPTPPPAPEPPPVDPNAGAYYYDNIKNLLNAECVMCHKAGAQAPDLSTYEAAKAAGATSLKTIQDGTMPPSGALSAEKAALFKEWVDKNYPEGSPTGSSDPAAPESCP